MVEFECGASKSLRKRHRYYPTQWEVSMLNKINNKKYSCCLVCGKLDVTI